MPLALKSAPQAKIGCPIEIFKSFQHFVLVPGCYFNQWTRFIRYFINAEFLWIMICQNNLHKLAVLTRFDNYFFSLRVIPFKKIFLTVRYHFFTAFVWIYNAVCWKLFNKIEQFKCERGFEFYSNFKRKNLVMYKITGFLAPVIIYLLIFILNFLLPGKWVTGYINKINSEGKLRYHLNGILVFFVIIFCGQV